MPTAYPLGALALALVSGLAFSAVGLGYRAGQAHGITATRVAFAICLAGVAFFAVLAGPAALSAAPAAIWVVAVLAGGGQFVALKMIGLALARGPLSPAWCAVNLNFLLTIAYAGLFLGESIAPLAYAGVAAAVACVLAASFGSRPSSPQALAGASSLRARAAYGLILLVLLVTNSLWITGIKHFSAHHLPDGRSYLDVYGNCYGFGVYVVLGLLTLAELVLVRRPLPPLKTWTAVGAFAAAGSVSGLWALNACASLPAYVVLPINSVMSLLTAAVVSVLVFGERRTPAWYATVGLAVSSVVLVNVPGR